METTKRVELTVSGEQIEASTVLGEEVITLSAWGSMSALADVELTFDEAKRLTKLLNEAMKQYKKEEQIESKRTT